MRVQKDQGIGNTVPSERLQMLLAELEKITALDEDRVRMARAPGRANIIGEHTDYNEGYVLPCTISKDLTMAAVPTNDQVVLHSVNLKKTTKFSLRDIRFNPQERWENYPKGVARHLLQAGYKIGGMTAVIHSTIAIGAGLGSSAALEVATALMFQLLYDIKINPVELALICFKAENEFVGVDCGIMDQFASVQGRNNSALFLDCRTLDHECVRIPSPSMRVVLLNTTRRRAAEKILNRRKRECNEAVQVIKKHRPEIQALRDLSPDDFEDLKDNLPPTTRKRCQHIVYENERVLAMVEALKAGNYRRIGELVHASHASCRDLYEVSCRELDTMVKIAEGVNGVIGCRMTGAGLGGCAVCLVWDWAVKELTDRVHDEYKVATGITPETYVCTVPCGAREVSNWRY